MTISERLKDLRISNGFTLKEVADRIGVSEGTVQRYESNAIKEVPYKSILALADLYDVDPGYIMGWIKTEPKDVVMMTPTPDEREVLLAYRKASEDRKDAIRLLLGIKE